LGEERFAVRTIDIKTVAVRPLGNRDDNRSSALELTITTTNRVLSGGPIGIIELSCWREIEGVVAKYGATKIIGSPPILSVPLRDPYNNVISPPAQSK
jgi:hypothetical protein